MKINIDIDENHKETMVIIRAKEWNEDLASLVKMINHTVPNRIIGVDGEQSILLLPSDIDYVFAEERKIYAVVDRQQFEVKMKLYEIEELLETQNFLRFSKSVIGNVKNIHRFEMSFNGNLCVHFKSGNKEYVSRNYVMALKQRLVMGIDKDET